MSTTTRKSHPPPAPSTGDASPERDLEGALHDVSNALTVVLGWIDRARSLDASPELAEALRIAESHARSGQRIARRAIGAEAPVDPPPPDLATLLEHAWLGVAPHAAAKGLGRTGAAPIEASVIEPATLAQIITNLLMNAIAFSPANGAVELAGELRGDLVAIRVRDDGPGIPAERRVNAFVRGRSTRPGGAGIGLAHARALARRSGGTLVLEDSPVGASFLLTWPRATQTVPREPTSREIGPLAAGRILVVEDDPAVLILLETALGARGADVVCARNVAEVDAALATGPFDAALIDLSPLGDRPDATLASLHAASPSARVVVISGSAASSAVLGLRGVSAWVRKPFDLAEVVAAIRA